MQYRTVLSGPKISRTVFHIKLKGKNSKGYIPPKTLCKRIHEFMNRAEVIGDSAVQRHYDENYFYDPLGNDRASEYKHNYSVAFDPMNGAFAQFGGVGGAVRLTLTSFYDENDKLGDFLYELQSALGLDLFVSASRVAIEDINLCFALKGVGLSDLKVQHHSDWAGGREMVYCATSTAKDAREHLVGYQFGEYLTPQLTPTAGKHDIASRIDDRYYWTQSRSLAVKEICEADELPQIILSFKLAKPKSLTEFEEMNPFAGLELLQRDSNGKLHHVTSWEPTWAWSRVLMMLRGVISR